MALLHKSFGGMLVVETLVRIMLKKAEYWIICDYGLSG